jgi:cytochrome c peroxidase
VSEFDPKRGIRGADCFHCHGGALFVSSQFANNGLELAAEDIGRMAVTKNAADRGKFKVPSLRNIALTAPYMHDGRFGTLEEVVEHYSSGVRRGDTLDPNLAKHPQAGIQLSPQEKADLVAFLKTLTDETFTQTATAVPR